MRTLRRGEHKEGLGAGRVMMTLASMGPLFVLWAIRGTPLLSNLWTIVSVVLLILVPHVYLVFRLRVAQRQRDTREIIPGQVEDNRSRILLYLFAVLFPLYSFPLDSWRALLAALVAVLFMIFVFLHLNLHHMNVLFAIAGYRVFTAYGPRDQNIVSGRHPIILITKRQFVDAHERVTAYRLSGSVFLEMRT